MENKRLKSMCDDLLPWIPPEQSEDWRSYCEGVGRTNGDGTHAGNGVDLRRLTAMNLLALRARAGMPTGTAPSVPPTHAGMTATAPAVGGCNCGKAAAVEKPGLLKKAANFAGAVARHVAGGMPTVPDEEKNRRLAICRGCPMYEAGGRACEVCGCKVEIKAGWALEECPEGRW